MANKATRPTDALIGHDAWNIQLDKNGNLKHFLTTEGLGTNVLNQILDTAESFANINEKKVKKVPLLRGRIITNLFFEDSTRTRTTFELAAKLLSADVINFNVRTSATSKGETLLDTLRNIEAMHSDMFVVRHAQSGAAHFIAEHASPRVSVINAGDGRHAHPTQALLDLLTVREKIGHLKGLNILIVGDIAHSRVARSNIVGFQKMGATVMLAGPPTMMPMGIEALGARVVDQLDEAIPEADIIMMLRVQKERQRRILMPSEREYANVYGLNLKRLQKAKRDVLIMHPGPMNRGVEIAPEVADGPYSVILDQVTNGVAVRMALLYLVLGGK